MESFSERFLRSGWTWLGVLLDLGSGVLEGSESHFRQGHVVFEGTVGSKAQIALPQYCGFILEDSRVGQPPLLL